MHLYEQVYNKLPMLIIMLNRAFKNPSTCITSGNKNYYLSHIYVVQHTVYLANTKAFPIQVESGLKVTSSYQILLARLLLATCNK